jgi:two-component system cell cycle sensor histidine kinase/response regulator CckA
VLVVLSLRHVPIAVKLPLGIGLLLVAVLGGVTWASYTEVRRSILSVATERMDSLSQQLSALLEVSAHQRFALVQNLAAEPAVLECLQDPNSSTCAVARSALGRFVGSNNQILAVELWDTEGAPALIHGAASPASPRHTASAIEAVHASDFGGVLGSFGQDDQKNLLYRVVADVRDGDRLVGYVSEVRRVTNAPEATRQLSDLLGSDARFFIGTPDGLWTDFSRVVDGPPIDMFDAEEPVEYQRAGQAPVLAQATTIAGGPWLLVIEFPVGEIFRPAENYLRKAGLVSLLIVILCAGVGLWFSRGITKPLELVTQAAESIASGKPGSRVSVSRRDELGRLQSSFNTMATEVEQSRQRLEGLARRYKLLFDESPLPMWVTDAESGRFLDVNAAALHHYGYSLEEFRARTEAEITVAEIAVADPKGDARSAPAAAPSSAAGRIVRQRLKSGRIVDVECTRRALTVDGRSTLLTLAHDVTERTAAERSLRENEAKLQQLNLALKRRAEERALAEAALRESQQNLATTLDSIGDAVISTDAEGRIVRLNPVAEQLTRWSAAEARGRPLGEVFRVVDEDNGQAVDSAVERVLREGVTVGLPNHAVLIPRDGPNVPISDSAAPIRNGADELQGVVLVFRDISAERAAQRALLDKEARKSAVLEAAIDGIVTIDHRGDILEFNGAAERIFGIPHAKAIGQPLADLIIPARERDKHRRGLAHYVATGEGPILGKRIEVAALRSNGKEFAAEISIVRSGRGEPPVFTGFIRDVSERKQLEAQLRQSQKMEAIGRLAGGVAHDFNNLLSVIIGYADLLAAESGAEARQELAEITAAGQRGAHLTRQLLAFSRQQVLQPQVLDLNQTLSSMESMLQRLIGEDLELALRLARRPALVNADPGQIEQIVMNLVVNARDAMLSGGKLTIEVGRVELDAAYAADHPDVEAGPFVMLAVSDTGIGMDEATKARVFEPFFTTKEKGKGTGLGLATVFGIVKQSGGSIWLYSEPNGGTTFKVYLPEADRSVAAETARAANPTVGDLRGRETILLVEDDDQLRALSRNILERQGYRLLNAASGDEALRICQHHAGLIHLLLTDVVMPRMSGRQLADRLRALRPETKTLYMSGYTDEAITQHGVLDAGVAFVQKPLTARGLAEKVREVLDAD